MKNWLLRPLRMWLATRFFMKHWQVDRAFAHRMAAQRVQFLEKP